MEPLPTDIPAPDPIQSDAVVSPSPDELAPDPHAWRDELSARLNRYRARRKAPPPRYPSLRLPFGQAEASGKLIPPDDQPSPAYESVANHALALSEPRPEPAEEVQLVAPRPTGPGAKIIEFPRFAWAPPEPPPDQLAGPVVDYPRILEVPEMAPPAPALGGITIEPARVEEVEKRPGIDIPLQNARLARRIAASLIDGLIIAAATALFGFIFWKVTAVRPPRLQIAAMAAGVMAIFWAAYHYLLIVYSASTPGLRIARLELTRFDGSPTRRSLRRWRVLASYLSAASLGMGYAWLFLDEDELCWHDRITRTYLAPKVPRPKK
jgi:uncharacterized RDD family membrane protein YckC